jgi:hypothetical protein
MAQDLTVNIKTTSDVPKAMEKSKSAVVSFSKQVEDIQKKFSTTFKDVFLSFLGPMALITGAIAIISKMIADSQRKQEEATRAAIEGTNELMSAEDRYWARKQDREKKAKQTIEEAETARITITREFLDKDPRGRQMLFDFAEQQRKTGGTYGPDAASKDKAMQDKIQALIAEEAKKNPLPEDTSKAASEKAGSFKGPEGFGTVVGVGANPVMEAMTRQNEILEEIKLILQEQSILDRTGVGVPPPFTDRAVPLTAAKEGVA